MKTATILPLLCVLAAAAPTFNKGAVKDVHRRQTTEDGNGGLGDVLGGLKKRQNSDDGSAPVNGLLGGLSVGGGLSRRQFSDDDSDEGLEGLFGGVKRRQSSETNGGLGDDLGGGQGPEMGNTIGGITESLPVDGLSRRQSSESDGLGDVLGGLGVRQSSESDSNNGDNDDSLLNLLGGDGLKVDGNGQNINVADLRRRQNDIFQIPHTDFSSVSEIANVNPAHLDELAAVVEDVQNDSAAKLKRRQLRGLESDANNGNQNRDNDDTLLNAVDGSHAGVNQNAQNISVAELKRKRQLLGGLGGLGSETESESESGSGNGNGDNDESLLNALDGSTAQVDRNIQNVTILRRYQTQSRHESVSLAAKARRWLSTLFGRAPPSTTVKSGNDNDNEALANALDDSAAAADDNAQDISVLRRRQVSSPSSSPSPSPSPSPSVPAVPSASAAPIAPAQDPAAAPAPAPALKPAANDNNDNNSNDDTLVNTPDGSSADISKNLQNITVLKRERKQRRSSVSSPEDDDSTGDDGNNTDTDTDDDGNGDDENAGDDA